MKYNILKYCFILYLIFTCYIAYNQELPVYNEYHLNKSLINPAIVGSEPCTWIKATDRHQWVGLENSPTIQTLSFETSLFKKKVSRETDKKIHGIGVYIYHDLNGANRTLGMHASYSYHVYLNKANNTKLGLGLSLGLNQVSLDERTLHGAYDPTISGTVNSILQPEAGFGLFIYNSKFYAGLSGAHYLSSFISSSYLINKERNYFLIAGYLAGKEKDALRILPSIVIKAKEDFSKQIDLNGKILFGELWWLGLSYRHNFDLMPGSPTAILPMAGININNLMICYAYEYTPGKIKQYTFGTHEFTFAYRFCKDGFRCPVYR
jgi:type IX secretion system PorP/SprF family membrane protein